MRIIKFRAWNGRVMYVPKLFHQNEKGLWEDTSSKSTLMQYTGLTDKNGKEIYEGDIIRNFQADVNIVHWYVDSWCYENFHAGALPLGDTCNPYKNQMNGIAENQSEHEVIGNIHENPELL